MGVAKRGSETIDNISICRRYRRNYGANIYYNSGNVGIGTNNPSQILHVRQPSNSLVRIETDTNAVSQISGIEFGIPAFASSTRSKITSTTGGSDSSDLAFHTSSGTGGSAQRMVITSTGNVGIGTNNPGYRLEVSGGTDVSINGLYYGNSGNNSTGLTYNGTYYGVVAKFNGPLWTTNYLAVSSDIRIKEDIQDILDDTALQSILSIEPKTYKYVDKIERGDKKVYGFIAQQVKEVIPEAIIIEKSYIPNIYLVADYIDSVITLSSQPTKVVIKVNDKIKCYDKDNKEILVEVIEVIDDLTFRIKEIEYTDTKIFVYGTFVDDFHTLNKDYIFTLNVCATQELHRRIESQSVLLKSQDDRIKGLETNVAMLMSNM